LNVTHSVDFATFSADEMRVDAVVRNLEVIGEAAKNIPQAQRDLAPAVEWRKIAGLRDIVAHQYFGIDLNIIWEIVQNRLAELRREVTTLLAEAPQDTNAP
jgi:uncharacterized protein with HEPN domain